ncbi:MAG: hypothetical protein M3452_05080 [Chloroflexota bacterium]|nr:hypothetical protein [Chloroflexota bacterium]
MKSANIRGTRTWLGAVIATVALVVTIIPVSATDGNLHGFFIGNAYGTKANAVAGDVAVKLGRSAYQVCPCLGTDGAVRSNTIDTIDAGDAFRAATVVSTAQADKIPVKQAYIRMTSTIEDVDALDGLVTADLIKAVARTEATRTGFTTSSRGSKILGLRVAGQPVTVTPGGRFNISGFGYIELKDVDLLGDGVNRRGLQVEMLTIVITRANRLDLPIGTQIIVGHAVAQYDRDVPTGLVGGSVFAVDATSNVSTVENRFGRAAAEYLGCFSDGVRKLSNNVAVLDVPGVLQSGTGRTALRGVVNDDLASARGSSIIEDLDLLDGFITADLVQGVVKTQRLADGSRSVSYDGSRFVNLRVAGVPIGDDVDPNTVINVPGVGTLTLFETDTSTTADQIRGQVIMLHLEVDLVNTFDLPVGTEVRVAFARTQVETP